MTFSCRFRLLLACSFVALLLGAASGCKRSPAVSGIVVDSRGVAVAGARVRIQARTTFVKTGPNGRFVLSEEVAPKALLTAGKAGFYIATALVSSGRNEHRLVLKPIPEKDEAAYNWLSSLLPESPKANKETTPTAKKKASPPKRCEACHAEIVKQWKRDAHSSSATNPVFLSFFGAKTGPAAAGPSYLSDFPTSRGTCAACHVPAVALDNPFAADPTRAKGVAKEGVFCDFCHKISDTRLNPMAHGVLSIELRRPPSGRQIFFGPYDDTTDGNAFAPIYRESRYCAPCHNGSFWDVLVYSEFQEWADSSYAREGVTCQQCHMPRSVGMRRISPKELGGVDRDPKTIATHVNFGIKDKKFMRDAIKLRIKGEVHASQLRISVGVDNSGAGHHYPTGNPMRQLILLVSVVDAAGKALTMQAGERVPIWGGEKSDAPGNFAGRPGKGFAKILKDVVPYAGTRRRRDFVPSYPAPHWRPTVIESDTRIPANGTDLSRYRFRIPAQYKGPLRMTARLLFRRGFIKWLESKKLDIPDLLLAEASQTIRR